RHLIRAEARLRVRAALEQLPPRDREVLVLLYMEDLSAVEIAATLGMTEGAVRTRHLRALERLRRLMPAEDDLGGERRWPHPPPVRPRLRSPTASWASWPRSWPGGSGPVSRWTSNPSWPSMPSKQRRCAGCCRRSG